MNNKKRTYTIVAVLLAVVALGIGYAAATTLLTVNGTATALPADAADLDFTNASASGGQTGTSASVDGTTGAGVCSVTLKTVGETATCTFTIARGSGMDPGIDVTSLTAAMYSDSGFNTAWNDATDGTYFDISTSFGATTLANGETTTLVVTVELKQANLTSSNVVKNFYIKVNGDVANHS